MVFLGPVPPRRGSFVQDYEAAMQERLAEPQRARLSALMEVYRSEGGDVVAACREFWSIATVPRVAKGGDVRAVKSDLCTAPPEAIRFGMLTTNEATFASLGNWDWREDLAAVETPTLVIHGEEDAIPAAQAREWAAALPNGRFLLLRGTGHFPHAEKPEVVFPAIEAFLRGSWPKGAKK
jgi:pimeloyl-ACP methyl ester carboxylesterase